MAVVGVVDKWTPSRKAGEIPRVSTISPSLENKQAGAGRDGPTCLARPNSQARINGTGKNIFIASVVSF